MQEVPMNFRCIAMPNETVDRFRHSGVDDFHNPIARLTADADKGYFCRHCLAQPGKGHEVLLGSWNVEPPKGYYWQPSPIFLCAEACTRFEQEDAIPAAVQAIQLVNARPYNSEDRLLYDLNDTVTGDRLAPLVQRCLEDPRTRYVNIHTGRPGCFLCRVERSR
jgi:hypothetical protein